ncbi:hypothetical protein OAU50_00865 [Planctomycetota bacterium]|nr:hypothetical protein [Planctomycetota bacterium]
MYDPFPKFLTVLFCISLAASGVFAQSDEVKKLVVQLDNPLAEIREDAFFELLELQDIDRDLRQSFRATTDTDTHIQLIDLISARESDVLVEDTLKILDAAKDERLNVACREYLLYAGLQAIHDAQTSLNSTQNARAKTLLAFRGRLETLTVLVRSHLMPGDFIAKFDALPASTGNSSLLEILRADAELTEPLERAIIDIRASAADFRQLRSSNWREFGYIKHGIAAAIAVYQSEHDLPKIKSISRSDFQASLSLLQGVRRAAARAMGLIGGDDTITSLETVYQEFVEFSPNPSLYHLVELGVLKEEIEVALARLGQNDLLDARIARLRSAAKKAVNLDKAAINVRITARPDLQSMNQIGHLQHRAGLYKEAEATWTQLLNDLAVHARIPSNARALSSLSSMLSVVYYNLACTQSVQVKLSRSLENLKKAHAHGYKEFAWIKLDGDLEALRCIPAFQNWFSDNAPPSLLDDTDG